MNSVPTAYSPGAGSVKPSSAAFLAKNLCGICTRMPAPSPARGSAPTAPRCSRLSRMVSASATIWCDLRPLMSAMKPTPHEVLVERRIVEAARRRHAGIGRGGRKRRGRAFDALLRDGSGVANLSLADVSSADPVCALISRPRLSPAAGSRWRTRLARSACSAPRCEAEPCRAGQPLPPFWRFCVAARSAPRCDQASCGAFPRARAAGMSLGRARAVIMGQQCCPNSPCQNSATETRVRHPIKCVCAMPLLPGRFAGRNKRTTDRGGDAMALRFSGAIAAMRVARCAGRP